MSKIYARNQIVSFKKCCVKAELLINEEWAQLKDMPAQEVGGARGLHCRAGESNGEGRPRERCGGMDAGGDLGGEAKVSAESYAQSCCRAGIQISPGCSMRIILLHAGQMA